MWQLVAAHMQVSHDRLGCFCPDNSSIQVQHCYGDVVLVT
jgi:hypothetical protein